MSEAATQLLSAFDQLPPQEQHAVLLALLQRSGELAEQPLADNHLIASAEQLFLSLDAEENHGRPADAR